MNHKLRIMNNFSKLILLGGILICFWGLPVFAEENSTSTPSNTTSTPEVVIIEEPQIPTSTPEVIPEEPVMPTSTPTSSPEVVIPTSTPTTTLLNTTSSPSTDVDGLTGQAPTSTPTSTPEIETSTTTLATTTIFVQIKTSSNTLFAQELIFTECLPYPDSNTTTLNAKCALEQTELSSDWSYSGEDAFLNSISNYVNDYASGNYWNWFSNLEYGQTALNKHIVQEGETLLLTYSTLPLKIETSTASPNLNTTTTISVYEFGFDGWDPVWNLSNSSTLSINSTTTKNNTGEYLLEITTTTPYKIIGQKAGFIDTKKLIINPTINTTTTTTSTDESGGETSGGSNNTNQQLNQSTIQQDVIEDSINKILEYLKSKQDESGKIIDGATTDWAIMSFGAEGIYSDDVNELGTSLLTYEKEYNLDDPLNDLNSCATYPRHILALLAAGVEKNDNAIEGLKTKITTDCYNDNIYGLNGINDDVFALISLLAIDYNIDEQLITDLVAEIKSWQLENGAFSWPDWMDPTQKTAGDDITGASINALKYAQNKGIAIDNSILNKATDYLKTTQQTDGGWGYGSSDVMTTSWVLMGINAMGEGQNEWFNETDKNPWHPLTEQLNEDGFYESAWVAGSADWFALKHAVPAMAGKSWPIILDPIVENFSEGASFTYGGGQHTPNPSLEGNTTTTPTSTLDVIITTSTPTTTLDILTPTSTPTTTIDIATTTVKIVTSTPIVTTTLQHDSTTTSTQNANRVTHNASKDREDKINPLHVTSYTLHEESTSTQTISTNSTTNKQINQLTNKLVDELPIDSATRRNAKKVLAVSGGGSLLLGGYLALKLLRNLL